MSTHQLTTYLDSQQINYTLINHSPTYTAQETAQSAHIPGREVAKTVVVLIDNVPAMVIEPATSQVNLGKLKQLTGAKTVSLADERDFDELFPDCERGAMSPFGNLREMQVFVDQSLTQDEQIAFNADSHTEMIKLAYRDFEALVQPKVLQLQ